MDGAAAWLKEWSLAVLAAGLLGVSAFSLLGPAGGPGGLLAAGLSAAVAAGLLAFSVRVQRTWADPAGTWHVTRWCLGGVALGGFVDGWYRLLVPPGAAPPAVSLLSAAAVGAGVGAGLGYYDARLRSQAAELRRRTAQLDEFAGIVSHDLRNPLNIARGRLRELRGQVEDEAAIETIDDAHARMGRLIDEVLALARQGQALNEVRRVELADVAGDAWATVDTGGMTLEVDPDARIEADRERLRTLFENLFRNSVEHARTDRRPDAGDGSGGGGTVRVGELPDGFYVEDDGPGIPPEERERVFEGGYSTRPDGTGFGLAIVRRIAEAHGWRVRVGEGSAGGARFVFRPKGSTGRG